jgi:hypothetical protein
MPHITSVLIGGLAAVGAWALVVPPSDSQSKTPGNAADIQAPVNRAAKGDRFALPRLPRLPRSNESTVTTVEVVGIRDAAVIYRDRDGRILFQTDPVSNAIIMSKGSELPQLTVRETARSTPVQLDVPGGLQVRPPIPIGCDPVVSPVAQPRLAQYFAHVTGRCLA